MSEAARALIAGLLASLAFLTAFFGLTHPVLFPGGPAVISAALALATYAGVFLLLPRRRSLAEQIRLSLDDDTGLAPNEVAEALTGARSQVGALRARAADLPSRLQVRALTLADIADRIVARVESDPSDFRLVRRFLRRDLDGAADLVDRYARLDGTALDAGRLTQMTERFDGALADFERLFQKYHARTYDDEVFELEARLQLLEESGRKTGA